MTTSKAKIASLTPVQILAGSFLSLIIMGTILLMLPVSHAQGQHTGMLDALFTATSAVCVTGLIVVDTATAWSRFGQTVILILIQLGGIGIVSFGALFALLLGQKITFRQRELVKEAYGQATILNIFNIVPIVAGTTLVIEILGAVLLLPVFVPEYGISEGIWHSLFHAISAFCNAGFSTLSQNLGDYTGNFLLNIVICLLIVIGGLGFPVVAELLNHRRGIKKLSLHTRVVLNTTWILIVTGAFILFTIEASSNPEFREMPFLSQIQAGIFQSITARTAGFNTIPIGAMAPASLLILQFLMFIGGSPGGTAGGIKTTTFVAGLAAVKSVLMGHTDVNLFDKRIERNNIKRALVLTLMAILSLATAFFFMLLTAGNTTVNLLDISFETISAFGTVGLSTGITSSLTTGQRIVIIIMMFLGRLGPMTFALALARPRTSNVKFPETSLLTG